MGQEIVCRAEFAGKTSVGKALLESDEIRFRGEFVLKLPFGSIKELKAKKGILYLRGAAGVVKLELGARAEKWRDKIVNPKPLVEKLGVKPGDAVTLYGAFEKQFHQTLKQRGAKITRNSSASWVFFKVRDQRDLSKVRTIAGRLQNAAALWIVYPKGQKTIPEREVREAVLEQGLKDVKVASFSETHTALKFVLPQHRR